MIRSAIERTKTQPIQNLERDDAAGEELLSAETAAKRGRSIGEKVSTRASSGRTLAHRILRCAGRQTGSEQALGVLDLETPFFAATENVEVTGPGSAGV
jgi:hypothetical protein